jgi:hypothetical protein
MRCRPPEGAGIRVQEYDNIQNLVLRGATEGTRSLMSS